MSKPRPYYRTKIKMNVWRDPMPVLKSENYPSPHCANGACKWCRGRANNKKLAATRALQSLADANPGMFDPWEKKIGGYQEQLGPSSPDHWLKTFVWR